MVLLLCVPISHSPESFQHTIRMVIPERTSLFVFLQQSDNYSQYKRHRSYFSGERKQGKKWGSAWITNYIRQLKWTPIPLSLGFLLISYQHWKRTVQCVENVKPRLAKDWEIAYYSFIPLRSFSRMWGWINNVELPLWSREPILNWYIKMFDCDFSEADCTDLSKYKNLGEFFRRGLRNGIRPIDSGSPIVSPADGTILHFGKVDTDCGFVEQVKGVSYSISAFLGEPTWMGNTSPSNYKLSEKYCSHIMTNPENCLYHCVIYLAPGDYHRFHSPVDWKVSYRRHFSGELLSVNPVIAKWIGGLFSLNERVIYYGKWKHGFFSMVAVGSTVVGSIRVYKDKDLHTNKYSMKKHTFMDKKFENPLDFKKGDAFGEFNLGSTVVIIFEAPPNFQFSATKRIKFGKSLKHG